MYDYKNEICERYEYMLEEFQEEYGRKPNQQEEMELWEEAKDYVDGRLEARADYLRKEAKGE